ncbi:unnamed protein product [Brassica rapa]|nr:unnamed protein product [Brassica rapa]VDD14430.1 unnamed protein product [Brassica rapa]
MTEQDCRRSLLGLMAKEIVEECLHLSPKREWAVERQLSPMAEEKILETSSALWSKRWASGRLFGSMAEERDQVRMLGFQSGP